MCFLGNQICVTVFPVPFLWFSVLYCCYSADPLYFQDSYSVSITLNCSVSTLSLYISPYTGTLHIYLTSLSPVLAVNFCFNIKILCIFPTRFICVFHIPLIYLNSTNRLMFLMERFCVLFELGTEVLYVFQLKGLYLLVFSMKLSSCHPSGA